MLAAPYRLKYFKKLGITLFPMHNIFASGKALSHVEHTFVTVTPQSGVLKEPSLNLSPVTD